jgi:hypothetical protein
VQLTASVHLPDALSLANLVHGGRALLLREITFTGSYIVILLATAAHLAGYQTAGKRIRVLDDPWSPVWMSAFTSLLHTPRAVLLGLEEGLRPAWQSHRWGGRGGGEDGANTQPPPPPPPPTSPRPPVDAATCG